MELRSSTAKNALKFNIIQQVSLEHNIECKSYEEDAKMNVEIEFSYLHTIKYSEVSEELGMKKNLKQKLKQK